MLGLKLGGRYDTSTLMSTTRMVWPLALQCGWYARKAANRGVGKQWNQVSDTTSVSYLAKKDRTTQMQPFMVQCIANMGSGLGAFCFVIPGALVG